MLAVPGIYAADSLYSMTNEEILSLSDAVNGLINNPGSDEYKVAATHELLKYMSPMSVRGLVSALSALGKELNDCCNE